jgi:putative membrane protein
MEQLGSAATEKLRIDYPTKLAVERTWLAEERTMLAWVRTSITFVTFGFAIYSFFVLPSGAGHAYTLHQVGARIFAISLIVIGLGSLLAAVLQRHYATQRLRAVSPGIPTSQAGIISIFVGCVGLIGLIVVMFYGF